LTVTGIAGPRRPLSLLLMSGADLVAVQRTLPWAPAGGIMFALARAGSYSIARLQ